VLRTLLKKLINLLPLQLRSLGIAARLGIACSAVLVLVLATTYFAGQSSRRAAQRVATIEALHEPLVRLAQGMVDASAAFNQVVMELSNAEARRNPERVDAALSRMTELAVAYRKLAPDSSELMQKYLGAVAAHELRARELLVLADRRRTLIQQYWRMFDALDRDVHATERELLSSHSQSATTLSQALGRMQDRFGAYAITGGRDTERAIAEAETAFRSALERSKQTALDVLDVEHLAALQQPFESTVRTRRSLVALNPLLGQARQRFLDTGAELAGFLDVQVSEPARRSLAAAAIDANVTAEGVDRRLWQLGLATMSVLLLISALTAYGVIIPVRKLVTAIRALADGKRGRRVSVLGSVQELDTLATAFNDMSEQLEKAEALVRDYQTQLEARVDERTRQLEFLAHHDPLTKLPNRRQLADYLESALQRGAARVGVLFLDLDNFKTINDSLGHEIGDTLLSAVGQRLNEAAGKAFVARLGGDEFTVIYDCLASAQEVAAHANAMVECFQRAFEIDGKRLAVSVSIGAAVYPDHAKDAQELLRAADAALARAKEAGRNRCSVYGPELLEAASARFQIEQNLRHAIEHEEFELFYQPVMSADRLELVAVEALLRWRRSDGKLILPGQFLAVAERSGLIKEISEWMLETAVRQAALWSASGWPGAKIAINVSSQQLLDASFHVRLENTLEKYRLAPQCLEIELTETALQTGAATIDALHWLRSLGITVALDDFGTGYSSLTSLQQLPLTRVKIDRSLLKDVDNNPRSASIVRSIIRLCRSLGLAVTAEGVERRAQFALLRAQNPVSLQGFLISEAVPVADIVALIAQCEARLCEFARATPAIQSDASVSDSMIVRQLRMIENGSISAAQSF
jgi:diguanylate cyclase (GGDEF)-like protein